jgi:hypothetical protein
MSFDDAKGRLDHAAELLALRWQDTQAEWDDPKRDEVEDEFLRPLFSNVTSAMSALDRLRDVLARAERDCRPDA